jgi:hypothetical protein
MERRHHSSWRTGVPTLAGGRRRPGRERPVDTRRYTLPARGLLARGSKGDLMEKHTVKSEQHRKTGASNLEYDLFSEMHSLLKGNAALERYIEDAREAGDRDVESCFKTIQDQNKENVHKLRDMIAKHIGKAA